MIYYDQNKDDNKMLAHLSRTDSETGYDDYDPRDAPEGQAPEEEGCEEGENEMSTNEMITALVDQLCGHEAECPRLKSRQETPEFGGDDTAPRPDCTCFARLIMALEAEQ